MTPLKHANLNCDLWLSILQFLALPAVFCIGALWWCGPQIKTRLGWPLTLAHSLYCPRTSCGQDRFLSQGFGARLVSQSHHWTTFLVKEDDWFRFHIRYYQESSLGSLLKIPGSFYCIGFPHHSTNVFQFQQTLPILSPFPAQLS